MNTQTKSDDAIICTRVNIMQKSEHKLQITAINEANTFTCCYFAPVGVQSIAISVSVCPSVRSDVSKLHEVVRIRVTCGRGSVLLWQRCNRLCTSRFVDVVTFSHDGANGPESKTTSCFVRFARCRSCSLRRQACSISYGVQAPNTSNP